jgi:hypothetical protein
MNRLVTAVQSTLFLVIASQAHASLVTSLPGGVVDGMPPVEYVGSGPQVFDGGQITWSSQGRSVFGYDIGYSFVANGTWDAGVGTMAGVNDSFDDFGFTDTMTFALTTPVAGIGGLLNYVPGGSTPTTIAVYDSNHGLIESYDLNFSTGGADDSGFFYAFLESSPIISYFTLTDNYVGIADLTTQASPSLAEVPEPSMTLLLGAGIGLIGLFSRRATR